MYRPKAFIRIHDGEVLLIFQHMKWIYTGYAPQGTRIIKRFPRTILRRAGMRK